MTDEQIVETLVTKVMGWTFRARMPLESDFLNIPYPFYCAGDLNTAPYRGRRWNPLTSISDAFAVVEKMRDKGYLYAMRLSGAEQVWFQFWRNAADPHTTQDEGSSSEETLCRAICLAAIAATEPK